MWDSVAVIAVIGAITAAAVTIIGAWNNRVVRAVGENVVSKAEAVAGTLAQKVESAARGQDKQLNKIELLVDGRYGEILQEMADIKAQYALVTGREDDRIRAEAAQKRADSQKSIVARAEKREEESNK